MRITTDTKNLADALKTLAPAVSKRSALPVLAGVRLDVAGDTLRLSTTDLELGITTTIDGRTAGDALEGSAVVTYAELAGIVKTFPKDSTVTLDDNGGGHGHLTASATTGPRQGTAGPSATLRTMPLEDFPAVSTEHAGVLLTAEAAELASAWQAVSTLASKDEARPILTGTLFEHAGRTLTIVSTDSYRLGVADVDVTTPNPHADATRRVIPARVAGVLAKHAGRKPTGHVSIILGDVTAGIRYGRTTITTRYIDGEFPNWRQLMPDVDGHDRGELTAPTPALAASIAGAAAALGKGSGTPLRLELDSTNGTAARVTAARQDGPSATYDVAGAEFRPNGTPALTVAFNPAYLASCLAMVGAERATLSIKDALKPAMILPAGSERADNRRRALLMPVRIS